jgi:hypothetical protein
MNSFNTHNNSYSNTSIQSGVHSVYIGNSTRSLEFGMGEFKCRGQMGRLQLLMTKVEEVCTKDRDLLAIISRRECVR